MFNISSFLEKFSKSISSQELETKTICDVVLKHTGIILDSQKINIKNNILYLNVSPAVKNKIFIYKQKILEDLNNQTAVKIINIY